MFLTRTHFSNKRRAALTLLVAVSGAAFASQPGDVAVAHPLLPGAALVIAQGGTQPDAKAAAAAGDHAKAIGIYNGLISATPKKFTLYLERGLSFYATNQFDKAAADFSKFIEIRPNLVEGYVNRAFAYSKMGKFAEGLADLDKATALDSKSNNMRLRGDLQLGKGDFAGAIASYGTVSGATGSFLVGDVYMAQTKYTEAIAAYTKGLTVTPKDQYGLLQRGRAYVADKKYAPAVTDLTSYITLAPNELYGYYFRGIANLQLATPASYAAAKADLLKYIPLEKQPESALQGTKLLAVAQNALKEYKEAADSYSKVIAVNKNDENALFSRGMVYMSLTDYPNAIKDFNTYATAFPSGKSVGDAAYNLGSAYLRTKEYDKAVPAFGTALKSDPNDSLSYYGRMLAYYNAEQFDKAAADADQVIAKGKPTDPSVIDSYKWQALSYQKLALAKKDAAGTPDKALGAKAIATIEKYVTVNPKDADGTKIQNDIVATVGDATTQIDILTKNIAKTTVPAEQATLYFNRGLAYSQGKKPDLAIADLQKAATLDPKDKEIALVLAETQMRNNEVDGAIASYTKAIALNADKPELLIGRGDMYIAKKDPASFAKADADYTAYATKAGASALPAAFLTHAQLKRALGKTDEAITLYLKHLSVEKDEANRAISQKQLGSVYAQKADYANAIKTYGDYLAKNSKDAGVFALRAESYRLSGDTDKAMADANSAVGIEPANVMALTERGLINNKIGDKEGDKDPDKAAAAWDAAIADCDKAIATDAKYALAYYCKGFAAYNNSSEKGKADPKYLDTALEAFTKYIAVAPPTDTRLTSAKAAIVEIKKQKAG